MTYAQKARLLYEVSDIDQYRPILDKDEFKSDELHWNCVSKNTITLFQVLIDQDLSHLVMVLDEYPRYIPLVCDHFRYAYSYSENDANIEAASKLLLMGEPYFTKQFVRNVMRKLPQTSQLTLEELTEFLKLFSQEGNNWHPIIRKFYLDESKAHINRLKLHPLQRIALNKSLSSVTLVSCFEYTAEDRDKTLDIPYME